MRLNKYVISLRTFVACSEEFYFLAFVKPDLTFFQCVTQITEKTLDGQGNVIDSKTTKITKAAPEEVIPATTTQPIESIQSDPTEKTIEKDASETKVIY